MAPHAPATGFGRPGAALLGLSLVLFGLAIACAGTPAGSKGENDGARGGRKQAPCDMAAGERARVAGLLEAGKLDRAVRVIRHADTLCPASAHASSAALVATLAELGRFDEARETADRIDATPNASGETRRAAARAREAATQPRGDTGRGLVSEGLRAKNAGEAAAAQRLFDRARVLLEVETGAKVALDVPNGLGRGAALPWRRNGSARPDAAPEPAPRAASAPVHAAWAASSDGRFLAFADGPNVSIVETETMRESLRLSGHRGDVAALAWSADDKTLASGALDRTARVWSVPSGKSVATVDVGEPVRDVWLVGDGGTLVCGHGDVSAWSLPGGHALARFGVSEGGEGFAPRLVTPDGLVVLASPRGALVVHHLLSGKRVTALGDPEAVALAEGGKLLATARGGAIDIWKLPEQTRSASVGEPGSASTARRGKNRGAQGKSAETTALRRIALAADGTFVAGEDPTGAVRVWEARAGAPARTLAEGQAALLAVTQDGKVIVRAGDRAVHVADARTGARVATLTVDPELGTPAAVLPRDELLLGARPEGGGFALWDLPSGAVRATLGAPSAAVPRAFALAPGGDTLALATQDRVVLLGVRSGEVALVEPSPPDVRGLWFLDGGAKLVGWSGASVMLWDAAGRSLVRRSLHGTAGRRVLAVTGDAALAAVLGEGGRVWLWDLASDRPTKGLDARPKADDPLVAFSPEGKTLALVDEAGTVTIWSTASGAFVRSMDPLDEPIRRITFSASGSTLALLLASGSVALLDPASGRASRPPIESELRVASGIVPAGPTQLLAFGTAPDDLATWDLIDIVEGRSLHRAKSELDGLVSAARSDDGRLVAAIAEAQRSVGFFRVPDGAAAAALRVLSSAEAAYVLTPDGMVEVFGDSAGIDDIAVCRAGALTFPFDLCKERFSARGLLRSLFVTGATTLPP